MTVQTSAPVPVLVAARALGKSVVTVRRWIDQGAPCARRGEPGRGRGALVVVEELQRWRAAEVAPPPAPFAAFLPLLERILADYHRAGDHRLVGLRDEAARLLYAAQLEYIAGRLETDHAK